jgi:hypothetical protein
LRKNRASALRSRLDSSSKEDAQHILVPIKGGEPNRSVAVYVSDAEIAACIPENAQTSNVAVCSCPVDGRRAARVSTFDVATSFYQQVETPVVPAEHSLLQWCPAVGVGLVQVAPAVPDDAQALLIAATAASL